MRRLLLVASLLGLSVVAILLLDKFLNVPTPKPSLKFAPDPTFITGPLDANGLVDYETALNTRLKGHTTPESNAVVMLFQATGPKPEGGELHADFYQWLGTKAPPAEGDYFQSHRQHFTNEFQTDAQAFNDLDEHLRRRPWKPIDSPRHAEWLSLNEKPLALVVEATQRKDYFHPMISRKADGSRGMLIGSLIPMVQKCREISIALTLRATLKLGEGKLDEALEDVLVVHRLSRLVARGGSMIELLVGIATQSIAHQCEVGIFEHGKPTAKQALAYQSKLLALPPMASLADKINLLERYAFFDAVQAQFREQTSEVLDGQRLEIVQADLQSGEIELETSLRFGHWWFNRFENALRKPTRDEKEAELAELDRELKKLVEEAKHPSLPEPEDFEERIIYKSERIGLIFLGLFAPPVQKVAEATDRGEQTHRNAIIVTALAAYFADENRYPEKLTELVPKYLKELSNDLFTGEPLIYRKTDRGYLLYSVGVNGRDDGGMLTTDDPRGDDIGVRIPWE